MRFRFTIRDLLWLTLVVALIVGWWVDHGRLKKRFAVFDLIKAPNEYGGLAIAADDEHLYRVVYPKTSFGGEVEAYRLSDGALLWKTQLKALGAVAHFGYSNQIVITVLSDELIVDGDESQGTYSEVLDKKSGKLIRNNVFKKTFPKREDYKQE